MANTSDGRVEVVDDVEDRIEYLEDISAAQMRGLRDAVVEMFSGMRREFDGIRLDIGALQAVSAETR